MAIRLVVAEDSLLVREGIVKLLGAYPEVEIVDLCVDLPELLTAVDRSTPDVVLTRFGDVAAAGQDLIQTDLPQSLLPFLAELAIKAKEHPVTKIELTPEGGIDEYEPDFAYIQQLIQQTLHPPTPTPTPEG